MSNVMVNRKEFVRALKLAARVGRHRSMDVPNHSRLIVENGRAALIASNLAMSIRASWAQEGSFDGLIPTRRSLAILSHLDCETVDVGWEEANNVKGGMGPFVIIDSNVGRYRLATSPDEMVGFDVPTEDGFTVDAADLKAAIAHVRFAVSADKTRDILTGIYFDTDEEGLRLVATDAHRLAVSPILRTGGVSASFLLVNDAIRELWPLLSIGAVRFARMTHRADSIVPRADGMVLKSQQIGVTVASGDLTVDLVSNAPSNRYPNWRRVVPQDETVWVTVNRASLRSAAHRLGAMTDHGKIVSPKLVLERCGGGMTVTCDSSLGYGVETLLFAAEPVGEMKAAINAGYLTEVLGVLGGETVVISQKEPLRPFTLFSPDSPEYRVIVMPMHIGCKEAGRNPSKLEGK